MVPFGLTNAPISFQEYIHKIFAKKLDIFVIVYLDDILIYTDDDRDGHIAVVWWVLEQLRNFLLFAKLKKCWFYQEKVWFFDYLISSKCIRMKDKKIEVVKQWLEPKSVQDIQVFLGFANFYWQFIQGLNWIAGSFNSMFKTLKSIESKTRPGEGGVGVSGRSRAGRDGSKNKLDGIEMDDDEVDSGKVDNEIGKKMSKNV